MHSRTPARPSVPPRPALGESFLLFYQALLYGFHVLKDPSRTDYIFLSAFYTNTLMPGRHLDHFCEPACPLPPLTRLEKLPAESLGRTFAAFARRQGEGGLEQLRREAVERERQSSFSPLRQKFFDYRQLNRALVLTEQHDLWHVVGGYTTDEVDEVCLQAFTHAQVGTGLSLLITCGGLLRALLRGERSAFARVWKAYRSGRQTEPLLLIDWEPLWAEPLDTVRKRLGLNKS